MVTQIALMFFVFAIVLSIPITLIKIFDKRGREARK